MNTDSELKAREQKFHDGWAAEVDPATVAVQLSWEGPSAPENRIIREALRPTHRPVLDLGCGCGESSAYLAALGYRVIATDLSPGMVRLAQRVSERYGGQRVAGLVLSAEKLPFRDGSLGIVYGANVLHHVDTLAAVREARRVLVDGGQAAFWDPVAHNPIINVYRRLAMGVRTADEHPMTVRDIAAICGEFPSGRVSFCWLTGLLIFLHFFLVQRLNPSKIRYWKHVVERGGDYAGFLLCAERLDQWILRRAPWLGRWCWNVVIILEKKP